MTILIFTNHSEGLYKFRCELVSAMLDAGHEVHICLPNGLFISELTQMGCIFEPCEFNRHGINPFAEIQMIRDYKKIIKSLSPDVVLTYTIKPNVYGGMACASLGVPYIANITGLGTAVENGGILQKITLTLYKIGLQKAQKVFFQNSANQDFMLEHRIIKGAYDLLPGSGVNLECHCFEEYPEDDGTLTFLFIGRLMKDKGIEELIEASKTICQRHNHIKFIAIGGCEEDYKERLEPIKANCPIQFLGPQSDVHGFIKNSHAVILPTYHEGMSNVLQEAAASGRPVLASDIPGCRETFDEGVSGFGFKPRDVDSLCEAIEKFIALSYEKKAEMGRAGRAKMEREFNRDIVVQKYMDEINKIAKEH